MKSLNRHTGLLAIFCTFAITLSFSETVLSVDDGARAYWKGRDGTNVVSFQYLNLDMQASDAKQFDPGLFIYPNADTSANLMIASYARHMTLFNRPSTLSGNIVGGSADVDVDTSFSPPGFLPPEVTPGASLHQSTSGYGDPSVQLDVNLFGTPPLRSTVDLANYEPNFTLDAAVMLAFPLGQYDSDKLVNMGLNRWYGRLALPMKYHFGVFSSGRMMSFELTPSMWLFGENDDFLGQTLKNDSLWQLESHLTMDFTRTFYGSLDLLYRSGFQSEINGVDVGEKLDIGDLGFTLNYQATDNLNIRASYSSNVFGDGDLNTSIIRLQLVYGWHRLMENMKKLQGGQH
jgi:hypothetical protein